ncbi:MAG: TRAP transporter small permease subunit [Deltaproteobacteria bacterium]|nr:TRAP transporter small permease subunit [Deltaproteobacteria bacterium]
MPILRCIDNLLARIEGWLVVVMLWLMVILTFVQVALRSLYAYGHFHWANAMLGRMDGSMPFVSLLVLWLTFLGASLLTRDGKHIHIDIFSSILPERWLPAREVILALVALLICAMMLKVCVDYIRMEMAFGSTTFYGLPGWAGQMILPAGFGLLCFRFLVKVVHEGIRLVRGSP